MERKCKQGREYDCPYFGECKSYGGEVYENEINSIIQLWCIARHRTTDDKVWVLKNKLYTCHPSNAQKKETLFMEDVKLHKKEILEEILK